MVVSQSVFCDVVKWQEGGRERAEREGGKNEAKMGLEVVTGETRIGEILPSAGAPSAASSSQAAIDITVEEHVSVREDRD